MIARGFKPVAWVAAVGSAALGCYMLSLQVAAERAELAGLERRIVEARQDIRALQTELGTRGRLSQLERWNAEVLALSAPVAGQFLESNLSLARFDAYRPPAAPESEVRLASAEAAPAASPPPPPLATASAAQRPGLRLAVAELAPAAAAAPPEVQRAGLETAPAPVRRLAASAPPAAAPARALLDRGTLAELHAESRSERDGGTAN